MDKICTTCGHPLPEITITELQLSPGTMRLKTIILASRDLAQKQGILLKSFGKVHKELDSGLHQLMMEKISLLPNMILQEILLDNSLPMCSRFDCDRIN